MQAYKEIKELKELLDMGAITQEEFDAKKRVLLSQPSQPQQSPNPTFANAQYQPRVPSSKTATDNAPYNKMCIAGVATGGASLLINLFGITGIVAVVLSIIGISVRKESEKGHALAVAGIVMGALSILMTAVALVRL